MTTEHTITIRDGQVEYIHNDELAAALTDSIGTPEKNRASHVEPINRALRFLFHAIRSRVADDSRLAEWTRGWKCLWRARIFDGPTLQPFVDRAAAIQAEVDWLEEHRL